MAFAALGDNARAWELTAMINPVNHARTAKGARTYMVEPYVVAADVYALSPHTGRGGWTWYTGSAGWMYRLVVESLLGLNLEADRLRLAPCLPPEWNGFSVRYRYRETLYHIVVSRSESAGDGASGSDDRYRRRHCAGKQRGRCLPTIDWIIASRCASRPVVPRRQCRTLHLMLASL